MRGFDILCLQKTLCMRDRPVLKQKNVVSCIELTRPCCQSGRKNGNNLVLMALWCDDHRT